mmetsp:Transcript_24105/g.36636  ORF Transcript_24105/g.36636 Transcript_24105/m.36636 type:complete len:82 (-) Transcript_24105:146-391(-)
MVIYFLQKRGHDSGVKTEFQALAIKKTRVSTFCALERPTSIEKNTSFTVNHTVLKNYYDRIDMTSCLTTDCFFFVATDLWM